MRTENMTVGGIPAILWGDPSDRGFVYVHGKQGSKADARQFAELADARGWQTLSFDLPEHGDRTDGRHCDIWNGKQDLTTIADAAYRRWSDVSLFACSLGAWFSLQTYAGRPFQKCLFQSPIVDMRWLVEHMMLWSNVTEAALEAAGEIDTPIDALRWDYYRYIQAHPVTCWSEGTRVLYAAHDALQPVECIRDFVDRFHGTLTVAPNSDHAFMETGDRAIVTGWMEASLDA